MEKIDGAARSLSEVLMGKKYGIDYYQREYQWEPKQLQQLVNDLTTEFAGYWEPTHSRRQVEKYPQYFLGSIIISETDEGHFVVDGQQRLTSLTLLLTFLNHLQQDRDEGSQSEVDDLIRSKTYGKASFNLDVPERQECMTALFATGAFSPPDNASTSVRTLTARYKDLEDLFPDGDLRGAALSYFLDWLQHRVTVVQITTRSKEDAYTIFETMNDRGLKLTPADMLKGYLLSKIDDGEPRRNAGDPWRDRVQELVAREKDADADFLKTWIRSQYADSIRERKKGATPGNWDLIGTEFHRWLRNNADTNLGLTKSEHFERLVMKDFNAYSRVYLRLLDATSWRSQDDPVLAFVGYNADRYLTLQHQLLLASIRPDDDKETVTTKLELVGRYLDILATGGSGTSRPLTMATCSMRCFLI